jgi:hypothetical protein
MRAFSFLMIGFFTFSFSAFARPASAPASAPAATPPPTSWFTPPSDSAAAKKAKDSWFSPPDSKGKPPSAPASSPTTKPATKQADQASDLAAKKAGTVVIPHEIPAKRPEKRRTQKRRPRGSLAVVSLGRPGKPGWEMAQKVRLLLARYARGWAEQPGIADNLVGKPNPAVLPADEVGKQLPVLLQKLRMGGRPSSSTLWQLGRLVGVDYLLLVKVRGKKLSARLFSVNRQRFAPQGFDREGHDAKQLLAYIADQTRETKKARKKR